MIYSFNLYAHLTLTGLATLSVSAHRSFPRALKLLCGGASEGELQFANFQVDTTMKVIYTRGKMSENFQTPTCQRRKT